MTVASAAVVATPDSVTGVNGATGAANVLNAFTGDTINGAAASPANAILSLATGSTVPSGLTFDPATGNVSVAAGTPSGTYTFDYTICEKLNPTNCKTATESVTVSAAPVVATPDSVTGVNGATGAANVLNAFTGDTINGAPATAANAILSLAAGSTVPSGLTFDPATGNTSVAAGTPAGTYTFNYQICERLNPTNCKVAAETVTVASAAVVATPDSVTGVNGATGAANVLNAFTGDTINGAAASPANAILSLATGSTVPSGLTFDPATGNVSVAAGTPSGTYTFDYTICEKLNPTNCKTATISTVVVAAVITAVPDAPAPVRSGIGNPNAINAFANDVLNGAPVDPTKIIATIISSASNAGVALDPATGRVSVAPGVPAGTYTITYQICEKLNPANCARSTVTVVVDPALSAVSGTVYNDLNGNQTLDANEPRRPGWTVEVIKNGQVVATTTTNATGDYQVTGLLSGPGYSIQFRNPENMVVYQVIANVTLANNVTVVDENLPIDPSGVVYDSVTRNPIASAFISLLGANGAPLPTACFLDPSQQGQRTGATGQYRFDVVPGGAAQCPVGKTVYTVSVTPPSGYSAPSTVLIPQATTFDPAGLPAPVRIAPTAIPPSAGETAVYYLTFRLASGDPDILFNHIPLDPFLTRTPLIVTKTSIKRTASVGDLVPYTITVRNTENVQRAGVTIVDILPPGFKYVAGSSSLNGLVLEPVTSDRELQWSGQTVPANATLTYKLTVVVGAGVSGGDRINNGVARNGNAGPEISNRGQAVVSIVASSIFDCAEIIGKVYDDLNGNGYQDQGEPGIPAARLATVNGQLITTDEYGRYHITCAAVPDARIGSNFVLKVDTRTLPAGYAPTTDNPQSVRLTRGKVTELNFGVKKGRTTEIDVDARAFVAGGLVLQPAFESQLHTLAASHEPSQLIVVNYRAATDETLASVEARLAALKAGIAAQFRTGSTGPQPSIETNMSRATGTVGRE